MDGVEEDPRAKELAIKIAAGIRNNYDWSIAYLKTMQPGKEIPYHPNFEMSEEEYNELQARIRNARLYATAHEKVKVVYTNNTISFRAPEILEILEAVKINLITNQVMVSDYILTFTDTMNITSDDNPLRKKWKGYSWTFREPNPFDFEVLRDPSRLNAKLYRFTIGQIEGSNQVYISIKGKEAFEGEGVVEFEYPLIFNLP